MKTAGELADELAADPEAYFAARRAEIRRDIERGAVGTEWIDRPEPDPDYEDPGIPEARPLLWPRHALGTLVIWSCYLLDIIPWHDQRWYLHGQRGCAWGVSDLGFRIYGDN